MIKEVEVKTVKVSYFCDDCGGEVMCAASSELKVRNNYFGRPIKHICEICKKQYYLDKIYPNIKYIELINL